MLARLSLPPASLVVTTLDAARVGSTNTAILRFSGTPDVAGTAISSSTTAAAGTQISITERGLYVAELIVENDSGTVAFGVSKNTDAAGLTANPALAVVGMQEAAVIACQSGQDDLCLLQIPIEVTGAEASAVGGAVIRFHATNNAGAAPAALAVASARARVFRVADWVA